MVNTVKYECFEVCGKHGCKLSTTFMTEEKARIALENANQECIDNGWTPWALYVVYSCTIVVTDSDGNLISETRTRVKL